MVKIERISVGAQRCGEGPHWLEDTQSLVYVDIVGQNILRWDERLQKETKIQIESDTPSRSPIAGFTTLVVPIQGQADTYVIARGNSLATLQWDGCSQARTVREFVRVEQDLSFPTRFNDGKCDPQGNLWAGTMGSETAPGVLAPGVGSIYSFSSRDGSATKRYGDITLSNGMAWSADGSRFFFIDTTAMSVDVFDYDMNNTAISNRRPVFDLAATRTPGLPDGMTIDTQGRLWVALFFGGTVICLDPSTGQIVDRVHMPATNITSCAFGGPSFDTLYVTSATEGLTPWQMKAQPDAGATFKVTGLGARGLPGVSWRVDHEALRTL
ncbi:regucalcin-like [Pollicipes pollicipes]|uniref:regucalcin-like n=1 Tax=Pollicipes pollicipes TaxID=41117 RepID=UPI00188578BD|nr:regucalcin-like [Pollicipes pollicipes]